MKKKIMAGAVLLLAASIFIGGCGIKSVSTDTGAGYTVTDATGREVKIPKKPERIMGNSASIDTMLLGVVTPDKLIAATEADRDPAISYIANDTKNIKMTVPLMGLSMELVTRGQAGPHHRLHVHEGRAARPLPEYGHPRRRHQGAALD